MTPPEVQRRQGEPAAPPNNLVPGRSTLACVSLEGRDALRDAVVFGDARSNEEMSLTQFWRDLTHGVYTVADGFFSRERCYLVLSPMPEGALPSMSGRRLDILEAVLSGLPQKNIASELDLAASTIALNSRLALESRGVKCKPSRAHPLLMLAARVATEHRTQTVRSSIVVSHEGKAMRVLSAQRPDHSLEAVLPRAELAVIQRLIEGLPYAQIAAERGTSARTIANQITAVFRRLRVSGRNELIQRLFQAQRPPQRASQPITQTLSRAQIESAQAAWDRRVVSA